MTPYEFSKEILEKKELRIYEFIFRMNENSEIEVTNTSRNICDIEKYKTPSQAYFVYSYTLRQLDQKKQRKRVKKPKEQTLTYGKKTAKFKELMKEC
jgi:hypothetical protein